MKQQVLGGTQQEKDDLAALCRSCGFIESQEMIAQYRLTHPVIPSLPGKPLWQQLAEWALTVAVLLVLGYLLVIFGPAFFMPNWSAPPP